MLDDAFTTGGSIERASQVLQEEVGVGISSALVVVKREDNTISVPVDFLFDVKDLL